MARATTPQIETMRAAIEGLREVGLPDELLELYESFHGVFDNSQQLIALFGVVDQSSVNEAWELYNEFMQQYRARTGSKSRPTYH